MKWPTSAMLLTIAVIGGTGCQPLVQEGTGKSTAKDAPCAKLVEEYERAGLALRGTTLIPADGPGYALQYGQEDPRYQHFQEVRAQICSRGTEIVPVLLDFLRREVTIKRPPEAGGLVPGFTDDMIELLFAMSDPQATHDLGARELPTAPATMDDPSRAMTARTLLEISEGLGGKADEWKRKIAQGGLERLTHCAFLKPDISGPETNHVVVHPRAIDCRGKSVETRAAALFRDWLDNEGRDPATWVPLARQRAHALLDGDDICGIYFAAEFLRAPVYKLDFRLQQPFYDDQPDKTVARLASVIGEFQRREFQRRRGTYYWRGQEVPKGLGNWTQYITSYGPRARPYVEMTLKIPECRADENWGYVQQLMEVGGDRAMQHFIQCITTSKNGETLRCARLGIDRFAGRCFADDSQRLAWWRSNERRNEEQWLRDSLPILAAQCDEGTVWAPCILSGVLPECPCVRRVLPVPTHELRKTTDSEHKPLSTDWLKQHAGRLVFDAAAATFRLRKE